MGIFSRLSSISRLRKLKLFKETFQPDENTRILDVGAEIKTGSVHTQQLIDWYPWKKNLTAINLSADHISTISKSYPEIEAVVGDACQLPWPDKHFDIIYSNAVIEHVGDFSKQKQMAQEIMRAGKQWFVTTPNRWYPYEFHMRLPFVTWLPGNLYLKAGRIISYNHVRKKYMFGINHDGLRLMTARELKACFPNSRIIKQRVTFMAETLITIGGQH